MDKQGRILIPKQIRQKLHEGQTFKMDYIEEYMRSEPYNKATCEDAIILEICNERNNKNGERNKRVIK